jgi:hypothetical protein
MKDEDIFYLPEIPASGHDAEDLLSFIENESPEDVYLREKRDLDREIIFLRKELEEQLDELRRFFFFINLKLDRIDEFYKKYIDGSSKEDNVH